MKKAAGKMKMGGTGSKQEDQIITAAIEQKHRRQIHLRAL